MPAILLVGFKPFGAHRDSLPEKVGIDLNGKLLGRYLIRTLIMDSAIVPNEMNCGKTIIAEARKHHAKGIILLGMNCRSEGFRIEVCVTDLIDERYCPQHRHPLDMQHRLIQNTFKVNLPRWNVPEFQLNCRNIRIAAEIAKEPGTSHFNRVMWQLLNATVQSKHQDIPWIAINLPCTPTGTRCTEECSPTQDKSLTAGQVALGLSLLLSRSSLLEERLVS